MIRNLFANKDASSLRISLPNLLNNSRFPLQRIGAEWLVRVELGVAERTQLAALKQTTSETMAMIATNTQAATW